MVASGRVTIRKYWQRDAIELAGFSDIEQRLQERERQNRYRRRRVVESPQGRTLQIDGRQLLNFCSNDYLGLASDARVRAAFKQGIDDWGAGSGAAHLVCGHSKPHHELEEAMAEFTARPRCLLFSSGYAANLGVINGLLSVGDQVFEDRLNHASLLDGGWISRAEFQWFEHGDIDGLSSRLVSQADNDGRKLIVSDGTFSMDGDLCLLNDLVRVGHQHGAWIMIDDAHGFGVHGTEGRGIVDQEQYSVDDVQILVGTLGKAFGTHGAFVAGSEEMIETLIQKARTYIFSTALPPSCAVATLTSLEILRSEEWRRERLRNHVQRFRHGAKQIGLSVMPSESPIQPVLVGTEQAALSISAELEELGILVTPIRPPTVPDGSATAKKTSITC
jgi:8-amino-7-oxononanoate synthase